MNETVYALGIHQHYDVYTNRAAWFDNTLLLVYYHIPQTRGDIHCVCWQLAEDKSRRWPEMVCRELRHRNVLQLARVWGIATQTTIVGEEDISICKLVFRVSECTVCLHTPHSFVKYTPHTMALVTTPHAPLQSDKQLENWQAGHFCPGHAHFNEPHVHH